MGRQKLGLGLGSKESPLSKAEGKGLPGLGFRV